MAAGAPPAARTYDGQEKPRICACETPNPRRTEEHPNCGIETPPGLPAKGPEQSSAKGSGSSSGSSQDHEKAQKEQKGNDKIEQWKKDMTWKTG